VGGSGRDARLFPNRRELHPAYWAVAGLILDDRRVHAAGVELRDSGSGAVATAGPQEKPGGSQQRRQGQKDQESALCVASHGAIYGAGFVLASNFRVHFEDWVACLERTNTPGGSSGARQPEVVPG